MRLTPGNRLGPYEVLSPLGAGGMGEVWRARDERLGREVAIKVLPAEAAGDADRMRRFELETRSASALNHPLRQDAEFREPRPTGSSGPSTSTTRRSSG